MKVSYFVTENDYITLLASLIRKRDRRPLRLVMLFLLTLGQMGLIAWLCATRLERGQWPFYMIWSVLLAAFSILRFLTARLRARGTLYRLKDNGQLPEDYWKEHRLNETKEGLVLTYGGARIVCPPGALSSYYEEDGLLYLKAGDSIFDIVPLGTFASEEKKQAFLQALGQFQEMEPPQETGERRTERAENADAVRLRFARDGREFVRMQAAAFRTIYLRYQFMEIISLLKLAVTVFLIAVAAMNFSAGTALLAGALAVLLNRNHLMVLTPLLTLRVRKELGAWAEGGDFALAADDDGIRMTCGRERIDVPRREIQVKLDSKTGSLFSWGKLPIIIVPAAEAATQEGRVFLKKAKEGRSLR